ncbi:MAG: methyltransferase domain-containing protein [Candidatus Paceibacterota bacterium]
MSINTDGDSKVYSVEEFVEKFGFDKCAFDLLKFIESDNSKIKDLLISKYLGTALSAEEEEELLEYFINNSVFSSATVANPATSVVTEFLYATPKIPLPIDQYFFESAGGKAIHSRITRVEENIHLLTDEFLKKGNVLIGNLGGGPGRDLIDVFSKYYKNNDNVAAINIDRDRNANLRGKRMAEAAGVQHKIEFAEASFMKYKPKQKFDIIILVGVLCSLPPDACVFVLRQARSLLAKGGCVMASNVSPKMLKDDPFTYFIMEKITNWHLIFKEEELLKDIFKKSGLIWQKSFSDDYGFHFMGIGSQKLLSF